MNVPPNAPIWRKCRHFEDFFVGQTLEHHWGRTILESDTMLFTTLSMSFVPLYFNRRYAIANGHPDIVVNPALVFNTVLGLSVQDCSEAGGFFLGADDVVYHRNVYPGATLTAKSKTIAVRASASRPDHGIVTWRTEGFHDEMCVISFVRTNLLPRKS